MNKNTPTQQEAVQAFINHLAKFGRVLPQHEDWIDQHVQYKQYHKGTCLHEEGSTAEKFFYICSGMLARITYAEHPKTEKITRKIISLGTPNMGILTTDHLFTSTQNAGNIVSLRPSEILTIPYHRLKAMKEKDPLFSALMQALSSKKVRQLNRLRRIGMITEAVPRYMEFVNLMPQLDRLLLQHEKKDLLQISRSTVHRANYILLTGSNKRKNCVPEDTPRKENKPDL